MAGGIAAPTLQGPPESRPASDTRQMGREACFREWAEHARLLVEAGVDLIQAEYVGFIEDCLTAVDACSDAGATVFLGFGISGRTAPCNTASGWKTWPRLWRDARWGRSC